VGGFWLGRGAVYAATVTPESRCYVLNRWLVGCLARLLEFFISLAAQRRKFAIKDSKEERRLLIKAHDEDIQLRIIERPEERVNKKYPTTTRVAAWGENGKVRVGHNW